MSDLYENLLKATNNIDDITTEKYGTVTKINGNYCDVKEEDTGLEHTNVPIINGANLSVGDKAIIGFLNNSIYDTVCYGALDKTIHDDSKQDLLVSGTNIKTINHQSLLGSGNITIEGGGTGVDIVTSWSNPTTDTSVPSEKLTKDTLDLKLDSNDAFSGDYEDLNNKPTIPSKITDLTNDSNFIEKSSTNGLVKNDGTIDTTNYSTFDGNYNSLTNKPTIPSKTSDLTNDGDGTNVFVKNNDSRLTDARTPSSHSHGNITNDGKIGTNANYFVYTTTGGAVTSKQKIGNINYLGRIGSTANLPLITTTNGTIATGSFGSSANTFCEGNDSRLSDARTPTSHTHTKSEITDFPTIPSKTSDLTNDNGFITSSSLPTKTSDLTNDGDGTNPFLTQHQSLANYVQKSSTSGLLKNDGTVDTTQYLSSLPAHNHDDRYYTESEVDTALGGKQATLISGTNIKTINNTSLLGSGNINIQGGGSVTVDSALSTTSENPVQNKVITGALDGKADTSSLSTVATSGSYNDLSNKPNIPTAISDLANDSDFIETSSTTGLIRNDGSIDTNTYLTQHQDVSTWTSQTIATYGTLYVNTALRLCEFRYYRTNYKFNNTSEVTLHTGAIPSAYRPKQTIICAVYQVTIIGAVTTDGNIVSTTSTTGTKTINMSAFWHY